MSPAPFVTDAASTPPWVPNPECKHGLSQASSHTGLARIVDFQMMTGSADQHFVLRRDAQHRKGVLENDKSNHVAAFMMAYPMVA